MAASKLAPRTIGLLASGCVLFGFTTGAVVLGFGHVSRVRGAFGSMSLMTTAIGAGIAFWGGVRTGNRLCLLALLLGLPALAGWAYSLWTRLPAR